MPQPYVKFIPIPPEDQATATGWVYMTNGVATHRINTAGISIATEEEANDPDLGWQTFEPNP